MLPARAAGARRSAYVLRALACSTSVMLSTGCSPSRSLSLSWTPVVSRRRRERLEGVSPSPRPAGYDTVYKRFAQSLESPPPPGFVDSWQPPADSLRTLCFGEGVVRFPATGLFAGEAAVTRCPAPAPFAGEALEASAPLASGSVDKAMSPRSALRLPKTFARRLFVPKSSFPAVADFSTDWLALALTRLSQQPVHGSRAK